MTGVVGNAGIILGGIVSRVVNTEVFFDVFFACQLTLWFSLSVSAIYVRGVLSVFVKIRE